MSHAAPDVDIDDEIIVALSDYFDGTLSPDKKREVEKKIETDPTWKRAHAEMLDTKSPSALSGLQKARAPATFADDVTGTIHKRSGGRLFGKKTFGDRVPFMAILVLAMILLVVLAYILWTSQTGSLKVQKDRAETQPGSAVIDKP
ncbi:MAG: anti-sigma factor family protein [Kofleriaceae bacterium]